MFYIVYKVTILTENKSYSCYIHSKYEGNYLG